MATVQEKLSREKFYRKKVVREQLEQWRTEMDRRSLHFEYDVGKWIVALLGKLENGASEFHGHINVRKI